MTVANNQIPIVKAKGPSDIMNSVSQEIKSNVNPFLLFEKSAFQFHDRFTEEFASSLVGKGHVFRLRGEKMVAQEAFYASIEDEIPKSVTMGSNLDAFQEVLRGPALSADTTKVTYWIWTRCDVLFHEDRQFFWKVFEIVCHSAKELSEGWFREQHWGSEGGFVAARQTVVVVFTGRWETMGSEAMASGSALFRLSERYRKTFHDLSTRIKALRVVASS